MAVTVRVHQETEASCETPGQESGQESCVGVCHATARSATVWWNKQKRVWYTEVGGTRKVLAKGRSNNRAEVAKLNSLLNEQQLLAKVNGAISVARHCDEFLADAKQHPEPSTDGSYK